MKVAQFVFVISILYVNTSLAQGIRGTITNHLGEPLPFASIYLPGQQEGASSNLNGEYELKLPIGKHQVLFQYIGYETVAVEVEIGDQWVKKDIALTEQVYTLKEVEVKSRKEDPAYTIMRKAIAKRKFHLLQYDSYEVKVYVKGTGELTKVPFLIRKQLKEEGIKEGEVYTTESVSLLKFEQPDKIEENIISIRTSGENNNSATPSSFINQSFYNDKIADCVSPLAGSAFAYYRFEYVGSFMEGKHEINKIKVKPRSKGEQVFEGFIYIIEDLWAIHSLELTTSYMGFKIEARQNYAEVVPRLWMPVTHKYNFSGKVLGLGGEYRYIASCSDYKVSLNKDLIVEPEIIDEKVEKRHGDLVVKKVKKEDDNLLPIDEKMSRKQFRKAINQYEKEAIKERKNPEVVSVRSFSIDSAATKLPPEFWDNIRPIPLTEKEIKGYQRDDSVAAVEKAMITGNDSENVIKKKYFNPFDLVKGGQYNFGPKYKLNINPTIAQTYFNTIEGINVNLSGQLLYRYDSLRRNLSFAPTFRYGFSSNDLYAKGLLKYVHKKGTKNKAIYFEFGKFVEQINDHNPIHPHINTLSTLFFRQNFMKIYEKTFLKGGVDLKFSDALRMSGSLEWANRGQLYNLNNYSFFFNESRGFTANAPTNLELSNTGFPDNNALLFQSEIRYRPGLTYRIVNGRKYANTHNAPEILLRYRKGIEGLLESDVNFDEVQLGINHSVTFGVSGKLNFEILGGTFLNNRSLYFMDFHHFDGNRTILTSLKPAGSFRALDYYLYSTKGSYITGFTHYQFRKFLVTQLPELKFTGIRENVFANYLKSNDSPHYYEVGYSIDNIMRLFRVEAGAAFQNQAFLEPFFRVGIATFINFGN